MKLSVLPLSTIQLTIALLSFISVVDLVKDAVSDAVVGLSNKADVVDVVWVLGFGDKHLDF